MSLQDLNEAILVREDDNIQFLIVSDEEKKSKITIEIEDYEVEIEQVADNNFYFRTKEGQFFRESFGLSVVNIRCDCDDKFNIQIKFEVLARKFTAQRVESIIQYLNKQSENLWRVCLARSSLSVGTQDVGDSDPETLLDTAEKLVERLVESRLEIQNQLRQRLVPRKVPSWRARGLNTDVDPCDIVTNLDSLQSFFGDGDVVIRGRTYSVFGLDVTALEHTSDVYENNVLIGGIYSVRRRLTAFLDDIPKQFKSYRLAIYDTEYESLPDLLARITTVGMERRARKILETANALIRFFENELGLVYHGELRPRITPYVRSTRIYRSIFEELHKWYNLGNPSFTGAGFLIKLRSLSKIYEFYCLFRLLEVLREYGLIIQKIKPIQGPYDQVPEQVELTNDNIKIILFYEPKIVPLSESTKHLDLVDIYHTSKGFGNYWMPDFVLRIESPFDVVYGVLDAKYSRYRTVKEERVPDMFSKYFYDTAVYDAHQKILDSGRIFAVLALYPGSEQDADCFFQWRKYGIRAQVTRLPLLGGVKVLPEFQTGLRDVIGKFLELGCQRVSCSSPFLPMA
ncbi:MAG: hypothetical protein HQL60_01160 [Magnetococcales bacterium]|nr:hypothetical protein [Magnetococcales bacterium]